jgi:hypothetical protein
VAAALLIASAVPWRLSSADELQPMAASSLPDLSGLAWLHDNVFVAVHDAKDSDETAYPRVSLVRSPASGQGVSWQPIRLNWPDPRGVPRDLENVSRVPGSTCVLLAESGSANDGSGGKLRRIFLADFGEDSPVIKAVTEWPAVVDNVEGAAIARVGERLVFLFAERAVTPSSGSERSPSLPAIEWADIRVDCAGPNPAVTFGRFQSVELILPGWGNGKDERPVSAMDVDEAGEIYVVSAIDHGDDGPFRSVVWHVGKVGADERREPRVTVMPIPECLAAVDGFKVESIAVCSDEKFCRGRSLFIGTDDERYGGTLRRLPFAPSAASIGACAAIP